MEKEKTAMQIVIEREELELFHMMEAGAGQISVDLQKIKIEDYKAIKSNKEISQIIKAYQAGRSDSRSDISSENDRTASIYLNDKYGEA